VTLLFVDTSVLVALAFGEPGHKRIRDLMSAAADVFASPLLEAEFRAALARERVDQDTSLLKSIRWVLPDRSLSAELGRVYAVRSDVDQNVFAAGRARGADAWHLATALFLVPDPGELPFLTLDQRQRSVAEELGFATPS
jgi:predicted nucleic acid-binding protein